MRRRHPPEERGPGKLIREGPDGHFNKAVKAWQGWLDRHWRTTGLNEARRLIKGVLGA